MTAAFPVASSKSEPSTLPITAILGNAAGAGALIGRAVSRFYAFDVITGANASGLRRRFLAFLAAELLIRTDLAFTGLVFAVHFTRSSRFAFRMNPGMLS